MDDTPTRKKRGPAPTLQDRRKLNVYVDAGTLNALKAEAMRAGGSLSAAAYRLIRKGLGLA